MTAENRLFEVVSAAEAAAALAYFNHFQDACLESLTVRLVPEEPEGFGPGDSVRYEVALTFLHANYPPGEHQGDDLQRIKMRLSGITSLNVADMVPLDSLLQDVTIEVGADGAIRLDVSGLARFVCTALAIEEIGPWR